MISKVQLRVLAFLLLATGALHAQEYNFRTFGNAEGLSNLAVRQIYQDHVGFVWVSTEDGIYRYDGERFEAFGPAQGIPATSGAALGDAPDGSLLAGGDFGLYRLSGNRFQKVPVAFKSVSWAQGIQSDGKGKTFLGTDVGLVEMSFVPGQTGSWNTDSPRSPETQTPALTAFSWMETSSGTDAGWNSAAWTEMGLVSSVRIAGCLTGQCW